jgi:hypothetical protein
MERNSLVSARTVGASTGRCVGKKKKKERKTSADLKFFFFFFAQLIRNLSGQNPPESLIDYYLNAIGGKADLNWEVMLVSPFLFFFPFPFCSR